MGQHSVADAKNNLSQLIDRAIEGEDVVITRHGRPVVELTPIARPAKPLTREALDWLTQHRVGRRRPREDAVTAVRKVRDEWALACVREGAVIAEKGWQRALEVARPGMAEYELAGEIETYMRELGADDNFQLLSASQHNRAAHRPSDRALAAGDVLLGEITPAVAGEFVQICRTAVLGTPTARQRDTFALLDGALKGAMRAARPGVTAREIVEVMNAPIAAAGYGTYTKPPYMRTRGHSMALGSMDPEIALDSDQQLVKGMVFVMHPNQYIPETGYMMCGEPVLIADDGAHPLTSKMGKLESIPL